MPPFRHRDATTDFGAIVALTADRYSGRHEYGSDHPGSIHNDLSDLQTLLRSLGSPISGTDAYDDFEFVLDSLVGSVQPAAANRIQQIVNRPSRPLIHNDIANYRQLGQTVKSS